MAHVEDRWTRPTGEVDAKGSPVRERTGRFGRGKRWQAVWTDRPGVRRRKAFSTKAAAEAALSRVAVEQAEGRYVRAKADRRPLGELWGPWRAGKRHLKPTTLAGYDTHWRRHIEPQWADVPVGDIERHDVTAWVADLDLGASQRRAIGQVMMQLLDLAVDRRMLPANPLRGMAQPKVEQSRVRYLTERQVHDLAKAMMPHDLEVWLLALTGMRWGEMAGLQVRDLDEARGRLRIERNRAEAGGRQYLLTTKTGRHRDVPVSGRLLDALVANSAGRAPDDPLLPGPKFTGWTYSLWRCRWGKACRAAGLGDVGAHILRHTAASLAIEAGADVKVVQRMLGHSSAAMTLDLYGHLMDRQLDVVGQQLAAAFGRFDVDV